MLEVCLTEEESGRAGLCCHVALDCLCDNWNRFLGPTRKEERTLTCNMNRGTRRRSTLIFFTIHSAGQSSVFPLAMTLCVGGSLDQDLLAICEWLRRPRGTFQVVGTHGAGTHR